MRFTSLTCFSLLLFACATTKPEPSAPVGQTKPAAEGSKTEAGRTPATDKAATGDPIPADVAPISVAVVAQDAASYHGKKVAVEGVVTKMCKKKGCWFEVTDGHGSPGVLIQASRYHIFLNQGSEGKSIVAYGEFKREVQDLEEAKHLAQDAGEPQPKEAPVVLRLVADGVVIR